MAPISIKEYIDLYFSGNKSEFARYMNVTPQQVTKWVNDKWIISDKKVYSPKREISSEKIMNETIFLANVFSGAEYTLAEIRNLVCSGTHAEERAKRAKIMINKLSDFFTKNNYAIQMIGYNRELSKYQFYPHQGIFELGETYFNITKPGSIAFIFNNDIKSDMTFNINNESPRFMSGRFDQDSYAILFSEVQKALQSL